MYTRICKYCGKEFESESPNKQICSGPHYQICPICGKEFIVATKDIYRSMCCSDECKRTRRNRAIKSKVATKSKGWNSAKTLYTRICELCGKEFTSHSPKQKYCKGPHYRTCVICGNQFELTYDQIMNNTQTCSNECRIQLSRMATMGEHQGTMFNQFDNDPAKWILNNYGDNKPTYLDICTKLGRAHSTVQQCIDRHNCNNLVHKYVSNMEQEVIDYIYSICPDISLIHNDRNVIYPKELDIYLPQHKLAIECNPTYTHNSSISAHGEPILSPSYHKMKTDMCENAGIRLFHIFGYEWIHKQDIIKSMLRNMLGQNNIRIYARNCSIDEISSSECNQFLNQNHRQGCANSSIRLGLFYNSKLVSVMTFGKHRHTIGNFDGYELLRLCSLQDVNIVGGASKLFRYFVNQYHPDCIYSFSDKAHTSGKIYQVLGFTEIRRSNPGYVWVNAKTDQAYSRINAQKSNIKKFLHDDNIDLSMSESEIMVQHGFVKVCDSGTITWQWLKNQTI